jgi:hypothetical protein
VNAGPEPTLKVVKRQWVDPTLFKDSKDRNASLRHREELITGDVLAVDDAEDGVTYIWQARLEQNLPWEDVWYGTSYLVALPVKDKVVRCVGRIDDGEDVSQEFGPVGLNPVVAGSAAAAVRAGTLAFTAQAPIGDARFEVTFGPSILLRRKNRKELRITWETAICRALTLTVDQMELLSGDGKRFLLIPALEEHAPVGLSRELTRDFVVHVFDLLKGKITGRSD